MSVREIFVDNLDKMLNPFGHLVVDLNTGEKHGLCEPGYSLKGRQAKELVQDIQTKTGHKVKSRPVSPGEIIRGC
jgi:hypothetical protein